MASRAAIAVLFGVLAAGVTGCGSGGGTAPADGEDAHARKFASLLLRYKGTHKGQSPASDAAFKAYVKTLPAGELSELKIDPNDPDKWFVSPRDNQPYVLRFDRKAASAVPGVGEEPVIAHEKTGKDGKRYCITAAGGMTLADEATFAKLVPAQ